MRHASAGLNAHKDFIAPTVSHGRNSASASVILIFCGPARSSSLDGVIVAIGGMFLFSAVMNAKLAFPAAVFYLVSIHNRNMRERTLMNC